MVRHRKRSYLKRQTKFSSNRWNRKHLVNKYGNICHICKKPIEDMKDVTVDHVIPLSKGGMDTLDNMRPAHETCNQEKADEVYEESNDSI